MVAYSSARGRCAPAPGAQVQTDSFSASIGHRRTDRRGHGADLSYRTCPFGAVVLESFVYVTDNGNSSQFAFFSPICDGPAHIFLWRLRRNRV